MSFAAATPALLADGTTKPISTVKAGDKVETVEGVVGGGVEGGIVAVTGVDRQVEEVALMRVIDELSWRGLPLTREESEISFLLSEDAESARGLAGDLRVHENEKSGNAWQCYVSAAISRAVTDLPTRFDLLDSAWADLGYPEEMRSVIYPEGGFPSRLDSGTGSRALSRFMDIWQKRLSGRIPEARILDVESGSVD